MSDDDTPITVLRALVDELLALAPWWRGWARPISAADIATFEAEHHVQLWPSHRAVLLDIGDHAPLPARPGGAIVPLRDALESTTASSFVGPLAEPFPQHGSEPVSLEWDDEADDYADPQWLRGCLPLTGAGCDLSFVLVVSGVDRGRVWSVSPSAAPELRPTGLMFGDWYRNELEVGLERERSRVTQEAELAARAERGELEAMIALADALLLREPERARELIDRACGLEPLHTGLGRVRAAAWLLDGNLQAVDALADRDPPWGRCLAAIAAVHRHDDARALELFADPSCPATLGAAVTGHHALALARTGRIDEAIDVLHRGTMSLANLTLAARLREQAGQTEAAGQTWARVHRAQHESPPRVPHAPTLADAIMLPTL